MYTRYEIWSDNYIGVEFMWLTLEDAAEKLGVSIDTVHEVLGTSIITNTGISSWWAEERVRAATKHIAAERNNAIVFTWTTLWTLDWQTYIKTLDSPYYSCHDIPRLMRRNSLLASL